MNWNATSPHRVTADYLQDFLQLKETRLAEEKSGAGGLLARVRHMFSSRPKTPT